MYHVPELKFATVYKKLNIFFGLKMSSHLDSFRAFAFFTVYLFHCNFLKCGYLGVQAFFVLSGFLLTPILLNMKISLDLKNYFLSFYGRRCLRIFPLYYFYLLSFLIIAYFFVNFVGNDFFGNFTKFLAQVPYGLTYTYNFFNASKYFEPTRLMTHFWSLAVEEQFYLVWPLFLILIPKRSLKLMLLTLIFLGPLVRFSEALVAQHQLIKILNNRFDLVIYVLPFSYLDAFAMGALASLSTRRPSKLQIWSTIILVFLLGMITEYISLGRIEWRSFGYAPFMFDSYKYIWGYSLLNYVFAILIVAVKHNDFLPGVFGNSCLSYLGKISYGLYVYHFPVQSLVVRTQVFSVNSNINYLIAFIITVLVSIASYELMEKHFLKLKDLIFPKKAGQCVDIKTKNLTDCGH